MNYEDKFDEIFKESMQNASVPPPTGIFEGISNAITQKAAVGITKTALLPKIIITSISAIVISVSSYLIWQSYQPKNNTETKSITTNKTEQNNSIQEIPTTNQNLTILPETENSINIETRTTTLKPQNKADVNVQTPNAEPNTQHINTQVKNDAIETDLPKNSTIKETKLDSNKQIATTQPKEDNAPLREKKPTTPINNYSADSIIIPDVVTPNADGINDEYKIFIKGEVYFYLAIFDKNNNRIFETENKNNGWNCTLPNGYKAPEGDYFVKIIYQFKNKKRETKTIKLLITK